MSFYEEMKKKVYLLTEEQCVFVGKPVLKNEKPVKREFGLNLYDRKGQVTIHLLGYEKEGDFQEDYITEERTMELLGGRMGEIKEKEYGKDGDELVGVYSLKNIAKIFHLPMTIGADINYKPDHLWEREKFEKNEISLEGYEVEWLHITQRGGMRFKEYFDARKVLERSGIPLLSVEEYEEKRNFLNFCRKETYHFAKNWGIDREKLRIQAYIENGKKFLYVDEENRKNTPLANLIESGEINGNVRLVKIEEFINFKNEINEQGIKINMVKFLGITEDGDGVFDLNIKTQSAKLNKPKNKLVSFDYLERSFPIRIKAGDVAAHEIVRDSRVGTVRSVSEINSMDRLELARKLRKRLSPKAVKGKYPYDDEQFIKDLAVFIDQRVPKAYVKYTKGIVTENTKLALDDGIEYQYKQNYKVGSGGNIKAKHESSIKPHKMEKKEKTLYEINQEKREDNYNNLTKYLKKNGERLEKNEFKAVLFVINKMEIENEEKKRAMEKASIQFDVKENFLNRKIKKMEKKMPDIFHKIN